MDDKRCCGQLHDHIWRAADGLKIQASLDQFWGQQTNPNFGRQNHNCLLCMLYLYTDFVKMVSSSARITVSVLTK